MSSTWNLSLTRRKCFAALGGAAAAAPALTATSFKPMRGAFMILSTPYTASGQVDWEDLGREAEFGSLRRTRDAVAARVQRNCFSFQRRADARYGPVGESDAR